MITFAKARLAAVNHVAARYPLDDSAYASSRHGTEDDNHWHVEVGDRRFIVGGDQRFRGSGFPDVLVDKVTVARGPSTE
jgi:hypothetical protein